MMSTPTVQLAPATHYWVGFSGGADSTALLLILWAQGIRPLTAVHFNHGLRENAADVDAEWCRNFCKTRDIPFLLHHLDIPGNRQPGEGIEAAARRCRLAAWAKLTKTDDAVVLGHQRDDAFEDLLLRLGRGANSSGLSPLRPERRVHELTFLRPLLQYRRGLRYSVGCRGDL